MPALQARKKTKRPDLRPARARYWSSHTLEDRKIRNIMKSDKNRILANRITREQAYKLWHAERKGRMKGLIRKAE